MIAEQRRVAGRTGVLRSHAFPWLSADLVRLGHGKLLPHRISFTKHDNVFVHVEDWRRAQRSAAGVWPENPVLVLQRAPAVELQHAGASINLRGALLHEDVSSMTASSSGHRTAHCAGGYMPAAVSSPGWKV